MTRMALARIFHIPVFFALALAYLAGIPAMAQGSSDDPPILEVEGIAVRAQMPDYFLIHACRKGFEAATAAAGLGNARAAGERLRAMLAPGEGISFNLTEAIMPAARGAHSTGQAPFRVDTCARLVMPFDGQGDELARILDALLRAGFALEMPPAPLFDDMARLRDDLQVEALEDAARQAGALAAAGGFMLGLPHHIRPGQKIDDELTGANARAARRAEALALHGQAAGDTADDPAMRIFAVQLHVAYTILP